VKQLRIVSHRTTTDDAGGVATSHSAFGVLMGCDFLSQLRSCACALFVTMFVAAFANVVHAQTAPNTQPGAVIQNTGVVEFTRPGIGNAMVFTNRVSVTVEPAPSTATLTLLRAADAQTGATQSNTAGPTACRTSGGSFVPLSNPVLSNGASVNPLQPIGMTPTTSVHGGEAVFVQVTDADRNRDALAIDTVELRLTSIVGDAETLRLSETGVNTGVFVGYIQTRAATVVTSDCVLQVDRNSQLASSYVDAFNPTDAANANALVDPYGLVFDSTSGQPVNGAVVRLVNATTGNSATVFGDDGVSTYPAIMTTGSQVTDSGGTVYALPAGVFRFPLVAPGQYRLEVLPPTTHAFPSQRAMGDINVIPGGPFALIGGSFGQDFAVVGPAALNVDVPLDAADSQLFLQLTTTTTTAALGDFVQYTVSVENTGSIGTFQQVQIQNQLPWGVRYRAGSARNNGQVIPDPTMSDDGRTMTFTVPSLPPHARTAITYVTEVTQSARGPVLTTAANAAAANGATSNPAQTSIRLRDDFFRDTAIVMGRVLNGDCNTPAEKLPGVAGVRVYLEDGRYSVTDNEGKYHFEGVAPGSHVVQVDTVSIPDSMQPSHCDDFVRHSGRSFSQFVDVRGGALWRADFKLKTREAPKGAVNLSLNSSLKGEMDVQHSATVKVTGNALENGALMILLPQGLNYVSGSAQYAANGADAAQRIEPKVTEGMLGFKLGALSAASTHIVTFRTQATSEAAGALDVKAYMTFTAPNQATQSVKAIQNRLLRGEMSFEKASYRFSPRFDSLKAELKPEDRVQLDKLAAEWRSVRNVRVVAIGHTDVAPITAASQSTFKDNYELSRARAQAVGDYLKDKLSLKPEQLVIEGRGPDEPLAKNADAASLARNRRVEISIEGLRVKALGRLSVLTPRAEAAAVETVGVLAMSAVKPAAAAQGKDSDAFNIESLSSGVTWLAPQEGAIPAISSVKVAIQHAVDQKVELLINDAPVSALNFDGTTNNNAKTVAVSRWIGIDLQDGDNTLVAIVRDASGGEVSRLTRAVHFAGGAVRAEFVAEQSTLIADGKTKPVIALRMFDAAGKPARPGTVGAFSVDAPYRSWWEVQALQENQITFVGPREPTFQVDDDGLARLELEPSTQTGNITVRLRFNERQTQDLRMWLAPQARDWILVGLAEGTAAHKSIADNMQSARDAGIEEEGYAQDGRVAFFAKGRIKGDFLLTMAFDSARERKVEDPRLLGAIEPDKYYTVYGDGAEQRFEAASQEKLYVKLERQQFMALFGDFETGLTITELSRYSRTLTGFKSDFAGEVFSYSTFAAQTDQGFVKDELLGDGTSGLYRLSTGNIIANSDKIRIEVRDRFRSEVIVESRTLTRFIDYSIDYFNGTVFFKQPVASRDANFNPQFIIAEYEVLQGAKEQIVAGGRGAMKLFDDRVEVGASYMQEGADAGDTRLAGTDIKVKVFENTTLRAEVARSESDNPLRQPEADAYFTEIKHVSERVDASVYHRQQDSDFGFGQQLSTETGTRKTGLDGRVKLTDTLSLRTEAYQQLVLPTTPLMNEAERQSASAELRHETSRYGVGAGVRHVSDEGLGNEKLVSDLANLNGNIQLFNNRVLLKAAHDWSLNDDAQSADFPARSVVGVDYKLTNATTLFSEYEHTEGAEIESDMTRVGFRSSPWARAQLSSSLNQQYSEYGPRTFANMGLMQGWQINDRWSMDFGADQNKTIRGSNLQPFNARVPLASGSLTEDFFATSIAAAYRGDAWTMNSRVEHRDSDLETRWTYVGGYYREPSEGHAFSLAAQYMTSDPKASLTATRNDMTAALVRMGWAYRPVDSKWIVLDRLDIKRDSRLDTLGEFESTRVINNTNINWQADQRTQVGVQIGGRYVVSTFDGDRYAGNSSLLGFDIRRDLSARFDIGLHGTQLNSWKSGTSDTSVGLDVGITIARNMWVSVGYNFQGFNDRDFEASRYTAQGPFLKLRIKADQDTFKDISTAFLRPSKKGETP
jgi:uncharacterized repeat protein (TIGR01451 family)